MIDDVHELDAEALRQLQLLIMRAPAELRFVLTARHDVRLERQPAAVRRLLLRTSVLQRVNGALADLLTGDEGGERVLQDLEAAGAFKASGPSAASGTALPRSGGWSPSTCRDSATPTAARN